MAKEKELMQYRADLTIKCASGPIWFGNFTGKPLMGPCTLYAKEYDVVGRNEIGKHCITNIGDLIKNPHVA